MSEEVATICAMTSVGNSIFYRPKDKGVEADNAHNAFHRSALKIWRHSAASGIWHD